MKYRKFASQIPKIGKISEKRGHFSDGMWTSTRGRSRLCGRMWTGDQKHDFRVDVINGWMAPKV